MFGEFSFKYALTLEVNNHIIAQCFALYHIHIYTERCNRLDYIRDTMQCVFVIHPSYLHQLTYSRIWKRLCVRALG